MWMRRMAMLTFAVGLCLFAAMRTAKAALDTQLLSSTDGLLGFATAWERGAPRTIVLNGARLRLTSGHSPETLHALLDRTESACRAHSAGLSERLRDLPAATQRALPPLVLRAENAREGLVACLDLGKVEASFDQLTESLVSFAEEGDLQALGGVRMLRAEARAQGTFFVSTASDGPAPLWQMFPATGDAPGVDFVGIARPSASRRVLSSWQQQGAPAINVYESAEPPARLWQHYLADLTVQGWQVPRANAEAPGARHAQMLLRDGHQLVLSVETHKAGTLIAVMQLDAGPGVARVR